MKVQLLSFISAVMLVAPVCASAQVLRMAAGAARLQAPVERSYTVQKFKAPAAEGECALQPDFTVDGAQSFAPLYSQGFDDAVHGWQLDATDYVTWSLKKATNDFGQINPDDVSSLFVEGPYQVFRREKSSATSPAIDVPANATLSFYLGCSLNYEDMCSLTLSVIDGEELAEVWHSADLAGERPWQWRQVVLNLEAYAGRKVKFCFTYGPGTSDSFGTGGYMGDYYIDDFTVNGMAAVGHIDVMTGDVVRLVDLTQGEVVARRWSMPGAVPAESTEASPEFYYTRDGVYDLSLTVTDAGGAEATKTLIAFVTVTGTAPVARIMPPATFRSSSTRKPLVAPMAPVTFADVSTGFPEERFWTFTGTMADPNDILLSADETPSVSYSYLHDQLVGLEVSNSHGSSADVMEVSVEYSAVVNNLTTADAVTNYDMEDWGMFPGSNTRKITAYAEKFSKPSVPVMVDGAYVYFTRNETTELVEQIANVGVHLYTCEDGKPGHRIDSWWWSAFELDLSGDGTLVGTAFPFTEAPFVDDEFFIVVDGLPEFNEGCCVSFGMAQFRDDADNTAYILKDGEWISVPEYFGAGRNTSFMIYPSVHHSVMSVLNDGTPVSEPSEFEVAQSAGTLQVDVFSYLGYQTPIEIDADWLRMTSMPNGMTVDTIVLDYDELPDALTKRTAHVTLTDGASQLTFAVTQKHSSSVAEVVSPAESDQLVIYNLQGIKVYEGSIAGYSLPAGIYLLHRGESVDKIFIK